MGNNSDFIYYEGLIWAKLREAGLPIAFKNETNSLFALHTVVQQYAKGIIDGVIDFGDAVWKAKAWHKNLLGA